VAGRSAALRKGVLVIGGNLAGVQVALDLARSGIQVYLVERLPSLGQDSVGDLPAYLLRAYLLEATKHPNVRVLTCSEVIDFEGSIRGFRVKVRNNPRYVDAEKCTACGLCESACLERRVAAEQTIRKGDVVIGTDVSAGLEDDTR
jgi:heterodisulfide reductase subunit A